MSNHSGLAKCHDPAFPQDEKAKGLLPGWVSLRSMPDAQVVANLLPSSLLIQAGLFLLASPVGLPGIWGHNFWLLLELSGRKLTPISEGQSDVVQKVSVAQSSQQLTSWTGRSEQKFQGAWRRWLGLVLYTRASSNGLVLKPCEAGMELINGSLPLPFDCVCHALF